MIGEWDQPAHLISEQGTLLLNQPEAATGYYFLLDPRRCSGRSPIRATVDNIPQGDGNIPHRRWRAGYTVHLAIELWEESGDQGEPACGAVLTEMLDLLGLHVNAMVNPPDGGRYVWTPTGGADRMVYQAQILTEPVLSLDESVTTVEFDLDSPFPYYVTAAETNVNIADGATGVVTNLGNTEMRPVIHVVSPTTAFTITNHDAFDDDGNELSLVYDSTRPGAMAITGTDYGFFDFFREVAYLNGNENNIKPGIDILNSDFFPLVPGANNIEADGADILVKFNDSYA